MKIVFMGTSSFAVPALKKLINKPFDITGVVTQPDRPKGRGNKLAASPVKELAQSHKIPVYQPLKIKETQAAEFIAQWQPDLIIVVSYGQIIPLAILKIPVLGCINIHASLLPQYRGAAPIQRCLMNGDDRTGITTMFMNEGLDTGDILLQKKVDISKEITYGELHDLLADMGADLIITTIERLKEGKITPRKQNDKNATYAEMIRKEDELINWELKAEDIYNQIRALNPLPGAYTLLDEQNIKIFKARIVGDYKTGQPGEVVAVLPASFIVKTGDLAIEILEIQKQGRKRINAFDFLKGYHLKKGIRLG